jgi:hypothetical protein
MEQTGSKLKRCQLNKHEQPLLDWLGNLKVRNLPQELASVQSEIWCMQFGMIL